MLYALEKGTCENWQVEKQHGCSFSGNWCGIPKSYSNSKSLEFFFALGLLVQPAEWKLGELCVAFCVRAEEVLEQADYLYSCAETEKLYQLLLQYKDR